MILFPSRRRIHLARLQAENHRLHILLGEQRARMKAMSQQRIDASTDRLIERVVMAKHVKARTGATR